MEVVQVPKTYWQCWFDIASLAFQSLLSQICLTIVFSITLHYSATQLGNIATSGIGSAILCVNLLYLPLGIGLNQSLNQNVAQAFGKQDSQLALYYLNVTMYTLFIYMIPAGIVMMYAQDLLKYILIEDVNQTILYLKEYLKYAIVASSISLIVDCIKTYLVAIKSYNYLYLIYFISTPLHILWCYIFTVVLKLGLFGLGLSIILTELVSFLLLLIYMWIWDKYQFYSGMSFGCLIFKNLTLYWQYLKSAIPNMFHIYADWTIFNVMLLIAFTFGTVQADVQLAFANTSAIYFKLPISMSMAVMTYVGAEMASNAIESAKRYIIVAIAQFTLAISCLLPLLMIFRKQWASFYTNDEGVAIELVNILPYFLCGCLVFDGIQGLFTGILKGLDMQLLVFNSTVISYYVIAIPIMCYLSLKQGLNLQVKGIWIAFGIANLLLWLFFVFTILRVDVNERAKSIRDKIKEQKTLLESNMQNAENAD